MAARARWQPAYIGVGANLGEPAGEVRAALKELASLEHCRFIAASRLYRSPPVGYLDQPPFVNAAAALLTQLTAEDLHAALRELERRLGKVSPAVRFGPRLIDLDLLAYDTLTLDTASLVLPHPRLHERAFVLYPLAELSPDLFIPGLGRVAVLAARVDGTGVLPLPS